MVELGEVALVALCERMALFANNNNGAFKPILASYQ
jgi:hypothetical protein